MPRHCASCVSPHADEINRKLKAGIANADVSRWLSEVEAPITAQSIGRHAKDHLAVEPVRGRRPVSGDFLTAVVEKAHEGVTSGDLRVSVRDGIGAQAEINRQKDRTADRDLMTKIALALTGNVLLGEARVLDPEIEAIEAEYRPLLESGE
jgi:hypothetical protein